MSPSQSLVYTYDARNRLETVTRSIDGAPPQLTRYAYDAAGNRREMTGADGTRTEYAYDTRHRLASLVKRSAAGALLVGMSYTVDASGLRTALTESDPAGTTRTVAYAYDALKRLTAETITHRDPTRNRSSTWTYDRVGNRLTQTVTTGAGTVGASTAATAYAYDANDRLLSETTTVGAASSATAYTYDANGNTIQKATPAGPIDYTYDDANRLAEMRQSGERTTYAYDADGLRVGQTRHPASGDPVTTRYLQDPSYTYSQVIEQWRREGTGPTTLEASYAYADDLIAQTRYAGAAATTAHVQMDGFGSVRWLTDATGAITDAVEYEAFGNEIHRSGSTPTEHLYRGEQFDRNLGYYYLRARYYDSRVGRFATMDSFDGFGTDPQSLHKYAYANANPALYSDPSGNFGIISVGGLNIDIGSAVSFATSRAGITAAAKFSSELAFEWATGIPVITSPRGMLQAVKSLRSAVGDLAAGAIKRLHAGVDFEKTVAELMRLRKNTGCYKDGRPSRPPGCFIPDFFAKGSRLVEVKTSMGAVRKQQFQEFMRISLRNGQPMSMVFLRKPSPAAIERLQRWAVEVAGESHDILLNITHVLD